MKIEELIIVCFWIIFFSIWLSIAGNPKKDADATKSNGRCELCIK